MFCAYVSLSERRSRRRARWFLRNAHRRNPHNIAQHEFGFGFGALFGDAHFPGTNHAVNMSFGNAFSNTKQKIV